MVNEKSPQEKAREAYESMKNFEDFMTVVSNAVYGMSAAEYALFMHEIQKLVKENKRK